MSSYSVACCSVLQLSSNSGLGPDLSYFNQNCDLSLTLTKAYNVQLLNVQKKTCDFDKQYYPPNGGIRNGKHWCVSLWRRFTTNSLCHLIWTNSIKVFPFLLYTSDCSLARSPQHLCWEQRPLRLFRGGQRQRLHC